MVHAAGAIALRPIKSFMPSAGTARDGDELMAASRSAASAAMPGEEAVEGPQIKEDALIGREAKSQLYGGTVSVAYNFREPAPAEDSRKRHHLQFFSVSSALSLMGESRNACLTDSGSPLTAKDSHKEAATPPREREGADYLHACYQQTVKEIITAMIGRRIYRTLTGQAEVAANPRDEYREGGEGVTAAVVHTNAGEYKDKTSRMVGQAALRRAIESYLNEVYRQEVRFHELQEICQTVPVERRMSAESRAAAMRCVPIERWVGHRLFNPKYVGASLASTNKGIPSSGTEAMVRRLPRSGRPLVTSDTIVFGLQRYWRLHTEAAARARLQALRHNDTESYSEHISLLKVAALVEIMEKTDTFMKRIGASLRARTSEKDDSADSISVSAAATRDRGARQALQPSGDAYERFRAYVASSKGEFELIHRIATFVETQPSGLSATLLPHQMDGLRFLVSLHANHINGILADEMGVGKTMQTLAFLLHLKHEKIQRQPEQVLDVNSGVFCAPPSVTALVHRPHLLLAPLSVIREWRNACAQFTAESLRVAAYQDLINPVKEARTYDLVLLPIHSARTVVKAARRIQWDYIIVDEAHKAVSNLSTATAQSILALPYQRRLVLTGTPLNSDLQELWSLLYFLNPDVFNDGDSFEAVFRRPFQSYQTKDMELTEEEQGLLVLRLHQVLRPFLLRRTKADIDCSLRMTFHHIRCPLTEMQQSLLRLMRSSRCTPGVMCLAAAESSSDESEYIEALSGEDGNTGKDCSTGESRGNPSLPAAANVDSFPSPQVCSAVLDGSQSGSGAATFENSRTTDAALVDETRRDAALGLCGTGVSEVTAQMLCNHAFLIPFFSQVLRRRGLNELHRESQHRDGAANMALSSSGKFLVLHLLLFRVWVARRKVVIFSHWIDCVDLLMDYFESQGWTALTEVLTGNSSEAERQASVQRFCEDPECLFFVLSIKAGGCGINLQTAHLVVLLDRDYTATNEDQALGRVYRIGQRHTVRALLLTTADDAEGRVSARAQAKNKPRLAIIECGTYQLSAENSTTESDTLPATEDGRLPYVSGTGADASQSDGEMQLGQPSDRPNTKVPEFFTDGMTSFLDACLLLPFKPPCIDDSSAAMIPDIFPCNFFGQDAKDGEANADVGSVSCSLQQRWEALCKLVDALDYLVLTDEDRTAATMEAGKAERDGVAYRLEVSRPPLDYAAMQSSHTQGEAHGWNFSTPNTASQTQPSTLINICKHDNADEPDFIMLQKTLLTPSERPTPMDQKSTAHVVASHHLTAPALQQMSVQFWWDFAQLLAQAADGPALLRAALATAVENSTRCSNPSEEQQQQQRERRDRRAAKRLRLAALDVPDRFCKRCWEAGVMEDAKIRLLYLKHLEGKAASLKKPRCP